MDPKDYEEEKELLKRLVKKEIRAFIRFRRTYSEDLLILAFTQLGDPKMAIEAVDELFEKLWLEEWFGRIDPPIHRFLFTEMKKMLKDKLK